MSDNNPVINEQADRALGRIIFLYGGLTFVVLILVTFVMTYVNIPGRPLFALRRPLDMLSMLIILIPFYFGINRLFAARLAIGRDLVEKRAWREAIAALDPFAGLTQRFLDSTGEAHYLLSLAYSGIGEKAKAESMRQFILRHRKGPWAARLEKPAPPTPGIRPRPATSKRRRRF